MSTQLARRSCQLPDTSEPARVLYCLTHPIQYQVPFIRHIIRQGIDLRVVYATDLTAGTYADPGFGRGITWDVPLLDGYQYDVVRSGAPIPSGVRDWRVYYSGLTRLFCKRRPRVIWVHGWGNPFSVGALLAARRFGLPVMLRAETHLGSLRGGRVYRVAHSLLLRLLFSCVSHFLAIGSANREFYLRHGVDATDISLVPYAVDNTFFRDLAHAAATERHITRASFGVTEDTPIILFVGKLMAVKDPMTLLRAVTLACAELDESQRPVVVFAGDGPLRAELEQYSDRELPGRVRFLGFRNQTQLPAIYSASDVFVLPSTFEPWGLVVNEALNAGLPVIVSDRVGAAADLVVRGLNGDVFEAGSEDDLWRALEPWLRDPGRRALGGEQGRVRMTEWGFSQGVDGLLAALGRLT